MNPDNEPFLPVKCEREDAADEATLRDSRRKGGRLARASGLIVHGTLIILYTFVAIILVKRNTSSAQYSQSPVADLTIMYTHSLFRNLTDNPFAGPPAPEIDESWEELLANMNMRVEKGALERNGQTSVPLPEGGGHLVWLGAFHDLHCVKMLRQWNYRETYHPNLTAAETKHWASHADHCLELLRQSAMCHADLSLTTFRWDATERKPMFDGSTSLHTCVDWGRLMASIEDRVVSDDEIGRLGNPIFTGS